MNFIFIFVVFSASIDCPDMINFALGLRLNVNQPAMWNQLELNCCFPNGISCDSNFRVTNISWDNLQLDGVINGTALPPTLVSLSLVDNFLTGDIPAVFPSGIVNLDLRTNFLTGTIQSLPPGLITLGLHDNFMHGNVPPLPLTLASLGLGWPGSYGNHFTGSVALNRPYMVFISNNYITDIVVLDTTILGNNCDISGNPLLGNPNIAPLSACIQGGLYNANLLPNTISTTRSTTSTNLPRINNLIFTNYLVGSLTASIYRTARTSLMPFIQKFNSTSFATLQGRQYPIQLNTAFSLASILRMVLKCLIECFLFVFVLTKTPYKRELRKWLKTDPKKNEQNDLLSP